MRKQEARIDFDSAWKLAIEVFFRQALHLLFPSVAREIDWRHEPVFLNTELRKIRPHSLSQKRFVDVLARVVLQNGAERYVFVHIEIQTQPDPLFPRRMYVYHYRLFDTLQFSDVVSLAILADADPRWHPDRYSYSLMGCHLEFQYPTAKLLELDEQELENSDNPFALVVLAHLRALKARRSPELLFSEKVRLIRQMAQQGYNKEDIANLYKVVDYLMALPKDLEERVDAIVREVAREQKITKLTNLERFALRRGARQGLQKGLQRGIQQGLRKSILTILRTRFGRVPRHVQRMLKEIRSISDLERLNIESVKSATLEEFERTLTGSLQVQPPKAQG